MISTLQKTKSSLLNSFRSDAQIDVHRLTEKDDYMVCLVNRFKMNNPPIDARLTRSDDVEYLCWTKAVL